MSLQLIGKKINYYTIWFIPSNTIVINVIVKDTTLRFCLYADHKFITEHKIVGRGWVQMEKRVINSWRSREMERSALIHNYSSSIHEGRLSLSWRSDSNTRAVKYRTRSSGTFHWSGGAVYQYPGRNIYAEPPQRGRCEETRKLK